MPITDDHADHLAEVATELVTRVRDYDPEDNARWLHAALPDPADRDRLLYVLAAAVPVDQSWLSLTAWTRPAPPAQPVVREHRPAAPPQPAPRQLQPCGTMAAAARHRAHGEPLCQPCLQAKRRYQRERTAARRAAA